MTTFDDREQAFENRFAHDEALRFRAEARRNHAVGLWAAGLMKLAAPEAERYAEAVSAAAMLGGTETVVDKLREDLAAATPPVAEQAIREQMDRELAAAKVHIARE